MNTMPTASSRMSAFAVALIIVVAIAPCFSVLAAETPDVTIQNYVRVETDLQTRTDVENRDAFGKLAHVREAYDVT